MVIEPLKEYRLKWQNSGDNFFRERFVELYFILTNKYEVIRFISKISLSSQWTDILGWILKILTPQRSALNHNNSIQKFLFENLGQKRNTCFFASSSEVILQKHHNSNLNSSASSAKRNYSRNYNGNKK